MSLLDNFNLVYGSDMRVLDPSVEVNAVTGIGSQFHLEPFHTMRWVGAYEGSKSVVADHQSIAFRGHKTETMIPHIPIPPWPLGAPLAKTIIVDSKCHIYCHNPDVEIEGKQVGIAMLVLAPPFHCASVPVPASLGALGKLFDKVPGVAKLKGALGSLHKLNEKMAKLDEVSRKLQVLLEGLRVGQILGAAAIGTVEAVQEILADEDAKESADAHQEDSAESEAEQAKKSPFAASQEMLRSNADYQKARIALERGGKPGVEYYQQAQEIDRLACDVDARERKLRALLGEQQAAQRELARQGQKDPQQRQAHRLQALAKAKLKQRLKSLGQDIEAQAREAARDKAKIATKRARQDALMAQVPSPPNHTQLGVMLPSLTSFGISAYAHSVKIGMSPASYWGMQLKVLAIVAADLVDHALGLVGDALLVGGPSSRVGSWVAELASGAFQGLAGSRMRAFGLDSPLDFSVPIKTGSLLAGGLIQGRAEFYWGNCGQDEKPKSGHPASKPGDSSEFVASRVGLDGPGTIFDSVQVHHQDHGSGIVFDIPELW